MINPLPLCAQRYVEAAQGWLWLGDWQSANDELENIEPGLRAHPDVLKMRAEVYTAAKRWDCVIEVARTLEKQLPEDPFGCLRLAYALNELKRPIDAWNALISIADKFPEHSAIPYNLACYAIQLDDVVSARYWFAQALKTGDANALKLKAQNDPDLAPLWESELT